MTGVCSCRRSAEEAGMLLRSVRRAASAGCNFGADSVEAETWRLSVALVWWSRRRSVAVVSRMCAGSTKGFVTGAAVGALVEALDLFGVSPMALEGEPLGPL